ncbi:hypothetical protein QO058_01565 [Bosea vestrisii]|uniref:hypothetical protein n=1 Tax=Bosea vestrisii TaxID=151416 RepID=UPI0024DF347A|nr:hypothetical protein [Bosea vestrisii]WID97000.1 hypothetical protein QO058_01565 [Bosea vestrisii]
MRELKRAVGISGSPGWDAIMTKDRRRALVAAIRRDAKLDAETRARANEIVEFIKKNTTPDIFFRG